jgi:hypothetical protein
MTEQSKIQKWLGDSAECAGAGGQGDQVKQFYFLNFGLK